MGEAGNALYYPDTPGEEDEMRAEAERDHCDRLHDGKDCDCPPPAFPGDGPYDAYCAPF